MQSWKGLWKTLVATWLGSQKPPRNTIFRGFFNIVFSSFHEQFMCLLAALGNPCVTEQAAFEIHISQEDLNLRISTTSSKFGKSVNIFIEVQWKSFITLQMNQTKKLIYCESNSLKKKVYFRRGPYRQCGFEFEYLCKFKAIFKLVLGHK